MTAASSGSELAPLPSPALSARWKHDGWFVLDRAVAPADIEATRPALGKLFPSAAEMDAGESERTRPWRVWDADWPEFPFWSRSLNAIVVHPTVIKLARQLLGTHDVRLYQALATAKYADQPSGYNQLLHADYPNHSLVVPRRGVGYEPVEMFIYLSDVSENNGATLLLSRTETTNVPVERHSLDVSTYEQLYRLARPAVGGAGSILAYAPDVYHRSVDITERGRARFLLHVSYRPADAQWIGYHAWPVKGFSPEWCNFVQGATSEQLEVVGFPKPGHPYWTRETLAGVQARYPGLDMDAWRQAHLDMTDERANP